MDVFIKVAVILSFMCFRSERSLFLIINRGLKLMMVRLMFDQLSFLSAFVSASRDITRETFCSSMNRFMSHQILRLYGRVKTSRLSRNKSLFARNSNPHSRCRRMVSTHYLLHDEDFDVFRN